MQTNEGARTRYHKLKNTGKCCVCGINDARPYMKTCSSCIVRKSKYNAEYAKDSYLNLKRLGVCIQCRSNDAEHGSVCCTSCKEVRRVNNLKYRQSIMMRGCNSVK